MRGRRLLVVTPTLKAAEVAVRETGADGRSAAWLIHQHGWRWDDDGHWTREPAEPSPAAQLRRGDLLLIDEAGMVDQDTALALLTIADEAGARRRVHGRPAPTARCRPRRRTRPRHRLGPSVGHRVDAADTSVRGSRVRQAQPGDARRQARRGRLRPARSTGPGRRTRLGSRAHGEPRDRRRRRSAGRCRHPGARCKAQRRDPHRGRPRLRRGCHRPWRADRPRRPGRDPPQRPRPRRDEPSDLDRRRDGRERQPHRPARPIRDATGSYRRRTSGSMSSSPTPPRSMARRARPSTAPTSLSAMRPAPRQRTSR